MNEIDPIKIITWFFIFFISYLIWYAIFQFIKNII